MLVLLFFASGALALVYQVLWQRQFALVFGSSSAATAAVLAAFFAGLGLGSAFCGRLVARWKRPLRAYAALELLIGAGALLVPSALLGFEGLYPWLASQLAGHPGSFVAVKAVLAFACLLVPTFCMGGTLPVLAEALDRGPRHLGVSVGLFYVANTAGAAVGALSVPFVLLPGLGMSRTLFFAALASGVVALIAWSLDRVAAGVPPAVEPGVPPGGRTSGSWLPSAVPKRLPNKQSLRSPATIAYPSLPRPLLLGIAAVSGGVTFALQVLWNRAFAQIHENSLHAFAVIAALFILALAVGGQAARIALRRGWEPGRLLGGAWLAGGACMLAGPWLFLRLTDDLAFLSADAGWAQQARQLLGLAFAVLFVPVALLGVGFPALMEAVGRDKETRAGVLLGRLLAVNIAGCVVGALAAGFVLPPLCGLWGSMILMGGAALLAGSIPFGWSLPRKVGKPTRSRFRPGLALAMVAVGMIAFLGVAELPRVRVATHQGERLLALSEGTHGIVAVAERPHSRRLKLNNHYALGGTLSLGDQRMQAHLPLLLHPAPRRVGHLGLGTGLSAGGMLFHPVSSMEVVELVPEVVDAARAHFAEAAAGLFSDPRTRIVVDDARNFLRARPEPFDVLIGDLVVPWRQGEGSLFTREHFAAARDALAPGGLFCQWLPLFQLSETETEILLHTFLSVFPRALVWRGDFSPDRPALGLVGAHDGFELLPATVGRRLGEMKPDPTNPQLADAVGFWMNFIGVLERADLNPAETRIHCEDRPWVELLGPRTHVRQGQTTLFTGRVLQRWMLGTRSRSSTRLPTLGVPELDGAAAGDLLYEFSLSLLERNEPEANRIRQRLEQRLPPAVFRAIFGATAP